MVILVEKAQEEEKIWTEDEFLALPNDGNHYELVNGELIVTNAGVKHGEIAAILITALANVVRSQKLGVVLNSSTGFRLKKAIIALPDVSFIAKERLQGLKKAPLKMFQGSPDLAVEILSPTDTIEAIHNKIIEYFDNDTKLVWVVNPLQETVLIHHSPQPDKLLLPKDTLEGEVIISGFSLVVSELFVEWDF